MVPPTHHIIIAFRHPPNMQLLDIVRAFDQNLTESNVVYELITCHRHKYFTLRTRALIKLVTDFR